MSILEIAAPITGDLDKPFWEAWKDSERFLLHRCALCGRHDWPASCCTAHGRAPMQWVDASGQGEIDTFTIFYRAYIKELAAEVPYTVAVIRLDEGPYFHTRVVGIEPSLVKTGMRVRLRRSSSDAFPFFVPA